LASSSTISVTANVDYVVEFLEVIETLVRDAPGIVPDPRSGRETERDRRRTRVPPWASKWIRPIGSVAFWAIAVHAERVPRWRRTQTAMASCRNAIPSRRRPGLSVTIS
jgi:hypothetical protein